MAKRKDITKGAIRQLLDDSSPRQIGLFEVTDKPLRRAIFEERDMDKSEPVVESISDTDEELT